MLFYTLAIVSLAYAAGAYGYSISTAFFFIIAIVNVFIHRFNKLRLRHHFKEGRKQDRKKTNAMTTEWINCITNRAWHTYGLMTVDQIKEAVEPILDVYRPPGVDSIRFTEFRLGDISPRISDVITHEQTMPNQIRFDFKFLFNGQDTRVELTTVVGLIKCPLEVAEIYFEAHVRLDVLLKDEFPYADKVRVSLLENPVVDFSCKPLIKLDIMDMPGFKNWVRDVIVDNAASMLVEPNGYDLDMSTITSCYDPYKDSKPVKGILIINLLNAHNLKVMDTLSRSCDPYVILNYGNDYIRSKIIKGTRNPNFNETLRVLIRYGDKKLEFSLNDYNNLTTDECMFRTELDLDYLCRSRDKLLPYTMTLDKGNINFETFYIPVKKFTHESLLVDEEEEEEEENFESGYVVDGALESGAESMESVVDKMDPAITENGTTVDKEDPDMELADVNKEVGIVSYFHNAHKKMSDFVSPAVVESFGGRDPDAVIRRRMSFTSAWKQGLLRMHIKSASNLYGENTLQPYAVVYVNSEKKFKTIPKIGSEPEWDRFCELLIEDCINTQISVKIKNNAIGVNEVIGDIGIRIDTLFIRTPGFNKGVFEIVDKSFKLRGCSGRLTLSLWFEPMDLKPDLHEYKNNKTMKKMKKSSKRIMQIATETALVNTSLKEKPKKLIVSILEGKRLKSVDFQGLSDPFVELYLNGKKVHKTRMIKDTLKPTWDEVVVIPCHDASLAKFEFKVKDWNRLTAHKRLGHAELDLKGKELPIQEWLTLHDGEGSIKIAVSFE